MRSKIFGLFVLLAIPFTAYATVFHVNIQGFAFHPASAAVSVGDTVTWTNSDAATHSVVADDGSFASANLTTGQSYSHQFMAAGSVPYHCGRHPSMLGTVVVSAATQVDPVTAPGATTLSARFLANPVRDEAVLEVTGGTPIRPVEVYNLAGQLMARLEGTGNGNILEYHLDTRGLAGGVYFLRIARPVDDLVLKLAVRK